MAAVSDESAPLYIVYHKYDDLCDYEQIPSLVFRTQEDAENFVLQELKENHECCSFYEPDSMKNKTFDEIKEIAEKAREPIRIYEMEAPEDTTKTMYLVRLIIMQSFHFVEKEIPTFRLFGSQEDAYAYAKSLVCEDYTTIGDMKIKHMEDDDTLVKDLSFDKIRKLTGECRSTLDPYYYIDIVELKLNNE